MVSNVQTATTNVCRNLRNERQKDERRKKKKGEKKKGKK